MAGWGSEGAGAVPGATGSGRWCLEPAPPLAPPGGPGTKGTPTPGRSATPPHSAPGCLGRLLGVGRGSGMGRLAAVGGARGGWKGARGTSGRGKGGKQEEGYVKGVKQQIGGRGSVGAGKAGACLSWGGRWVRRDRRRRMGHRDTKGKEGQGVTKGIE